MSLELEYYKFPPSTNHLDSFCPYYPFLVLLSTSHSPNIDAFSALIIFSKVMTLHLTRRMLLAQGKSRVSKLCFSEK